MIHVSLLATAAAAAVALAVPAPAQRDRDGQGDKLMSKLDDGLADARGEQKRAVFVRMADQLFRRAADYPAFCEKHADARRRELRRRVLADLRAKAEASWQAVAATAAELAETDGVDQLQRFWVVNGFACVATPDACRALAALDAVEFVYLKPQRVPGQHRGGIRARRAGGRKEALDAALEMWRDDSGTEFDPEGLSIPWNLKRVRADAAWKTGATGQGVIAAVLDTGLTVTPALVHALWRNAGEEPNGEDDDGNGYVDDVFGYDFLADDGLCVGDPAMPHGSMCAGIIAARPGAEPKTVTGLAPRARVMMLRGMGMLRAYEYALANGADIVSMSYMWVNIPLGNYRGIYRTAHEHMAAAGIVAVGGAGNFATRAPRGRQICLPKDIPCVIAAAGILEDGSKARASSEGPCSWSDVKFYADYPADAPLAKPDVTGCFGGYPVWARNFGERAPRRWKIVWKSEAAALVVGPGGNSFAGPHAGGVAALMLSANPDLPAWRVKELMEATCVDIGAEGRDPVFGAGLLQADAAVAAARKAARR